MMPCSNFTICPHFGFKTKVVNQWKMPTARSHSAVVGGLPDAPRGWPPSRRPRVSGTGDLGNAARTAAPRAAGNQNRATSNAGAGAGAGAVQGFVKAVAIPEGAAKTTSNVADADLTCLTGDEGMRNINPCDDGPPCEVWMGIQACGIEDVKVAMSLARNLFMNDFSRCLKVSRHQRHLQDPGKEIWK